MNTMLFKHFLTVLVCSFVLYGCASRSMPTGGPQDFVPPNLMSTVPADQSTNYRGRTIILEFDEYISLDKVQQNIQVSPLTAPEFEAKVKKNMVFLEFQGDFQENTTYNIEFGEAVQDITEKNKGRNIRLAFSTGDSIDSLSVSGKVTDLRTGNSLGNIAVMLYDAEDTSDIEKDKPYYYTLTDTSGYYTLRNLKAGTYKLYGLSEKARDFKYTGNGEKIAFLEKPVSVSRNVSGADLQLVYYDLKPLRIISSRSRKQYFEIKVNKTVKDYEVKFADPARYDTMIYYHQYEDIITFFNKTGKASEDSVEIYVSMTDSVGRSLTDTVKGFFKEERKPEPMDMNIITDPSSGWKMLTEKGWSFETRFNKPMIGVNPDSIVYQVDDDSLIYKLDPKVYSWNKNRTVLTFTEPVEFKKKMTIEIKQGGLISVENDTIPQTVIKYDYAFEEDFGKIAGTLISPHKNHIVQILDQFGKVEKEQSVSDNTFSFDKLRPGEKNIRIIIDSNNNGEWDMGDFQKREMPEQIYYYSGKKIELKANWELNDIEIKVK